MLATLAAMFMTTPVSGHMPLTNAAMPDTMEVGHGGRELTSWSSTGDGAHLSHVCIAFS